MQVLRQFSIPFKGLKYGVHNFDFELDERFFSEFEDSPVQKGKLGASVELERKHDHMELRFEVSGTIETECDRCTAVIQLPLSFESEFIIKFDEEEKEEEDIIYIHPESHHVELADIFYEQTILSLPLIKTYNCEDDEPKPCNMKVLDILSSENENPDSNNPFGEVLKDLKITKND